MGWWNGKFARFEVHFGYPDRRGDRISWQHMPRHDAKRSLAFASQSAQSTSKELAIYVRVFDATVARCVAMFFGGDPVEFTTQGEPVEAAPGIAECTASRLESGAGRPVD